MQTADEARLLVPRQWGHRGARCSLHGAWPGRCRDASGDRPFSWAAISPSAGAPGHCSRLDLDARDEAQTRSGGNCPHVPPRSGREHFLSWLWEWKEEECVMAFWLPGTPAWRAVDGCWEARDIAAPQDLPEGNNISATTSPTLRIESRAAHAFPISGLKLPAPLWGGRKPG